jgi:hypothetical protein
VAAGIAVGVAGANIAAEPGVAAAVEAAALAVAEVGLGTELGSAETDLDQLVVAVLAE